MISITLFYQGSYNKVLLVNIVGKKISVANYNILSLKFFGRSEQRIHFFFFKIEEIYLGFIYSVIFFFTKAFNFVAAVTASYLCAYILAVVIEFPCQNLEKLGARRR